MEGFLICTGKRTNQPLFIYETRTNIFSAEELCYYLYENIDILDKKLFDDKLIEFFKRCERADLALHIEALKQADASMEEFVRAVLSYVNYYSDAEIEQLCLKVKSFEGQPVEERLKAIGDILLKNKKYVLARKQYRRLLEMEVNEYMDQSFYGKIWHNLGAVYAGMMYTKTALECFETAYDIYPDENIKKSIFKMLKFMGNEEEFLCRGKDEAEFESWKKDWDLEESSIDSYINAEGETAVCEDYYQRGQMVLYYENVGNLIDKWKKLYREQMK